MLEYLTLTLTKHPSQSISLSPNESQNNQNKSVPTRLHSFFTLVFLLLSYFDVLHPLHEQLDTPEGKSRRLDVVITTVNCEQTHQRQRAAGWRTAAELTSWFPVCGQQVYASHIMFSFYALPVKLALAHPCPAPDWLVLFPFTR